MATMTQDAFLKAIQQIERKIAEVEATVSMQQMANDTSLKSVRKGITQHTETIVDQAATNSIPLEFPSREQQTLAPNIIHAARSELGSVEQVLSVTFRN